MAVSTTPEVDNLMAVVEEVVRAMTSRVVEVEAGGKPVSGLTTTRTCAQCQRTERQYDRADEFDQRQLQDTMCEILWQLQLIPC